MSVLKSLLSSKKFIVTIGSMLTTLVAKLGFDVDQEVINSLLAMCAVYVGGQSVADIGKEKAKQEAAAK
tara:strand:+ start:351 stop:557 length:207 start_codon:yes stop_codon:yes gene_type:complete